MSKKYKSFWKVKFEISGIANGSKLHVIDGAIAILSYRTIEKITCPCHRIDVKFLMERYPQLSRDVVENLASVEQKLLLGFAVFCFFCN
jgi:hypothetical protein